MATNDVIVITGPTGAGKSAAAVALAKEIGAEIVSADSVQIYKGMNIGSAKITKDEACGVRHHMLDLFEIDRECDVVEFRDMARKCIDDILCRGKKAIIAGGTGFYIQAIVRDVRFEEAATDEAVRAELYEISKQPDGTERLYDMLLEADKSTAAVIDRYNTKRLIRAIEFNRLTKRSLAEHNAEEKKRQAYYGHSLIVLSISDRAALYDKINKRVELMIDEGLEAEVRSLYETHPGSRILNNAIGYREMIAYIRGECSLQDAVELIKKNTRHFAKRQLTLFRTWENAVFAEPDTDISRLMNML